VVVVQVGGHVAAADALGVVGRPGLPRRAGERVQGVDEDLGDPELPQPVHAPGDLVRHVPDESGDVGAVAARVGGDARVVVAGDGDQRDGLPELPFPDGPVVVEHLLEVVDLSGERRRLARHLEDAGAAHGEVDAELVRVAGLRAPVGQRSFGAPKNLCCNRCTTIYMHMYGKEER